MRNKILLVLLLRKLTCVRGLIDREGTSAAAICQTLQTVPKGTIDPLIKELKAEGILTGRNKDYQISDYRVETVLAPLEQIRDQLLADGAGPDLRGFVPTRKIIIRKPRN